MKEKVVLGEGDMARVEEVFARDEAAYRTDAFYPEVVARLGNTYIFRDQPKLQLLYRISGFTENDLLAFDITSAADVARIVNFDLSGTGPYTLECEHDPNITGERTYLALSSGMTKTPSSISLDTALLDAIFTEDTRELGPAVSEAKLILLANAIDFDDITTTFLLFGDPAMTLKVPLPMRPKGLQAHVEDEVIALSWQEATDCEGGTVAGYNIYRALTPGGDYEKLNTALITGTEYGDASAEIGISYSYVVTSVDSDEDESVQSPAASTAGINAVWFRGTGCFIDTLDDDFN